MSVSRRVVRPKGLAAHADRSDVREVGLRLGHQVPRGDDLPGKVDVLLNLSKIF